MHHLTINQEKENGSQRPSSIKKEDPKNEKQDIVKKQVSRHPNMDRPNSTMTQQTDIINRDVRDDFIAFSSGRTTRW
jgi:hypothetical protein